MKSAVSRGLSVLPLLMIYPLLAFAITPAPPHDAGNGYTCASCHTIHKTLGATGYNNICLDCHAEGDPKGGRKPFTQGDMANPFRTMTANPPSFTYQNSHNWAASDTNPAAGASPPVQAAMTTNSLRARTGANLACVRCHDQHSQNNPPFLRMANDRDQLCMDCHSSRNRRDHRTGTHPVSFNYTGASSKAKTQPQDYYPTPVNANPANSTSDLPLNGGTVLCSTCHGVHHTDSNSATFDTFSSLPNQTQSAGFLLRTDFRGSTADAVNICSSCHRGKLAHNFRGQNVQCTDCHGGHVDVADGTQPNVWLVNRQMNFSSSVRSAKNSVVIFQSDTNKNYRDAGGNGVCQACHDVPLSAGYDFHAGTDSSTCNQCHIHGNQRGSFSVEPTASCSACHGYPPAANSSGPGGYAAGYQNTASFTDESQSGHTSHAATPYQKACLNCHNGNNHINGVYQDVFLSPAGTVAATSGLTPSYDRAAQTCATVYCHSNAAPRGGTMVTKTTPSWSQANGGGKGSIIGQPNECGTCHNMAGDPTPSWSLSHTRHINDYGSNTTFTCNTCHAATASGNAAIFNTVTARALHTNGVKDVVFNSLATGGNWNSSTATCTNVYCHSSVQGTGGLGAPTSFTANLTWNGSAMNCASCHAAMAKLNNLSAATGSHKSHSQVYSFGCDVCHGSGYTSNSVVIASHVNNLINISFTGIATTMGSTPSYYQGNNPPGGGYGNCANGYCHSSVQGNGGTWPPASFAAPTWGSGPLSCGSCHVNMATSAEASATGSHFLHANTQHYICSTCHSGAGKDPNPPFTATPLHSDGTIEIAFSGNAAGTSYSLGNHTAGNGYGTCSANLCHGASNPTWGSNTTKPRCAKCHGFRTAPWNALNGSTVSSDAKAGTHFNHITSSGALKYAKSFSCAECHAASIALSTDNVNAAGHFDTASPAELSFGNLAKTSALNPAYNSPAAGQCSNVYCHGNSLDKPASAILSPTWNQTFLTGVASNDCTMCHGYPPASSVHSGKLPSDCRLCHTHVNASGTGFTSPALHINGTIDAHPFPYPGASHRTSANSAAPYTNCTICHDATTGGGTYPVAAGTPPLCSACHLNMTNFTGTTPGCWDCHGSSATNGRPNSAAFPNISGSHTKHAGLNSTPDNCAICHNGFGSGNTAHGSSNRSAATKASVHIAFNGSQAGASATWTASNSTCSTTYCHSSVQGTTGTGSGTFVTTPAWGGRLTCGGCHQNMATSASATGSHASHAQATGTVYACSVCHGTGFTSTAAVYPPHVNNVIDLSFTANAVGTSYSKGTAITPGSALYGTCSANLCHGASNPTWGSNTTKPRCAKCHGFRSAPWNALNGSTASNDTKAGAHFNHISSAGALKFAKSFSCVECHAASIALSTDNVNAAGHFDTAAPAEIAFGTLAGTDSLTPGYNSPAAGQCSNVYCHGNSLDKPASAILSPTWNQTFLTGVASNDCAKCHGYPPATGTHSGVTPTNCRSCHTHVNASGTGFTNPALHINGSIESSSGHTFPYPGATHRSASNPSAPYTNCNGCHNATTAGGTYPVAVGTPPLCSACHLNMTNFTGTTPGCWDCHGSSATNGQPNGAAFPNIAGSHAKHAGLTSTPSNCAICHNGFGSGNTAHGSSNRTAATQASVHIAFNATQAGAAATWTQATATCSTTYCHSTVQGTTGTGSGTFVTTPAWGGSLTCGGCHQNMATSASATGSHASHAQSTGTVYACSVCHGTGFTSTAAVYPPHVNNVIDLSFTANAVGTSYSKGTAITPGSALYGTCSANLCHGASNPTWGSNTTKPRCAKCHGFRSAPWNALNGSIASNDTKAGAHFNHISSAGALKFAKSFSCVECHAASIALSTDNVNAAGHFDTASPAELSFGNLAKTNALTPGYNSPAAGQCSNVYCHGNSLDKPASAVLSPTWNQTFLTGVASNDCTMCHGYPPATPVHVGMTETDCTFCHPHVNANGSGFIDATKHVNGTIDFSGTPHSFPYPGSAHNSNAGTSPFTSCITSGCHVQGTAASPYPVTSGTPPDCRSCHGKAAPIGNPNRCDSCHGTSTNGGLPSGTAFPDIAGRHGTHSSMVCSDCHGTFGHGEPTHGDSNRQAHGDADVNVPFPAANAGFSFTRNGNGGGTCNGTCHGQGHSGFTW